MGPLIFFDVKKIIIKACSCWVGDTDTILAVVTSPWAVLRYQAPTTFQAHSSAATFTPGQIVVLLKAFYSGGARSILQLGRQTPRPFDQFKETTRRVCNTCCQATADCSSSALRAAQSNCGTTYRHVSRGTLLRGSEPSLRVSS
jgi:hypothetical protein